MPPLDGVALHDVLLLITQKQYFVLHALRQTSKTSAFLDLMAHLNAQWWGASKEMVLSI